MDNLNDDEMEQQMITVPAVNIIKKLRTKVDRQIFCRENSKIIIFKSWIGLYQFQRLVMI